MAITTCTTHRKHWMFSLLCKFVKDGQIKETCKFCKLNKYVNNTIYITFCGKCKH